MGFPNKHGLVQPVLTKVRREPAAEQGHATGAKTAKGVSGPLQQKRNEKKKPTRNSE